jgi:putative oxidoreductase
MRLSTGIAILVQGVAGLLAGPPLGAAVFQTLSIGLGVLLLAGLWTPVAGTLVAAEALWNVFSTGHPSRWILLATLGAALALIGPGAWSIDARLFGWRRLEIRDRKSQDSLPLDE